MFILNKNRVLNKTDQILCNIEDLLVEIRDIMQGDNNIKLEKKDIDGLDRQELFKLAKDKIDKYQLMKNDDLKKALKDLENQ